VPCCTSLTEEKITVLLEIIKRKETELFKIYNEKLAQYGLALSFILLEKLKFITDSF